MTDRFDDKESSSWADLWESMGETRMPDDVHADSSDQPNFNGHLVELSGESSEADGEELLKALMSGDEEFRQLGINEEWVSRLSKSKRNGLFSSIAKIILDKDYDQVLGDLRRFIVSEKRLRLAILASGDGIWEWKFPGNTIKIDYFYIDGEKVNFSDGSDLLFFSMVDPEDGIKFKEEWKSHLKGNSKIFYQEFRVLFKGKVRWVRACGKTFKRTQDGLALEVFGTVRDVTARKKMEESLRLLSKVFFHSRDGLVVVDEKFSIVEVNSSYGEIVGNDVSLMKGALLKDIFHLSGGLESGLLDGFWEGIAVFKSDRLNRFFETQVTRVKVPSRSQHRLIVSFRDVTDKEAAKKDLERLATQDSLTQLPNRSAIESHLQIRLFSEELCFAILFVDLDGFKGINDTYGHGAGDVLLTEVSKRILATAKGCFVGRWSGDAFVVTSPHGFGEEEAKILGESIRKSLLEPYGVLSHEVSITPSIGVVLVPRDGTEVFDLMQKADIATLLAKDHGRNRIELFNPSNGDEAKRKAKLTGLMQQDAHKNEFHFMIQSKVNRNGQIVGGELLMRWTTEAFGSVSPVEFIPMAEQNGLIHTLGRTAMSTAAKLVADLKSKGFHFPIAINIAPRQFHHPDIVGTMLRVCEEHRVHPSSIEVELTESALASGVDDVNRTLLELRGHGFKLALDDFGTGYSSLSHIHSLPFDKIKIDRIFVKDLPGNDRSLCVLKSMIDMCLALKFGIVAEGVETESQMRILSDMGVEEFQGFMFSKPISVDAWLRNVVINNGFHHVGDGS